MAKARELLADPSFRTALGRAQELERQLLPRPAAVTGFATVRSARVATAASALADFELELRRALNVVGLETPELPLEAMSRRNRPPDAPVAPSDGGLEIDSAESGSPLDVILSTYGIAEAVLLWNPLQVVLTLRALIGDIVHVRMFRRQRRADGSVAVEQLDHALAAQVDNLIASIQTPDSHDSRLRELYAEFETRQADGSALVTQIGIRREPPPPTLRRRRRSASGR